MSEETRWSVLKMAVERDELDLKAVIEWLDTDPENEVDDPETAYNQMYHDFHPELDV